MVFMSIVESAHEDDTPQMMSSLYIVESLLQVLTNSDGDGRVVITIESGQCLLTFEYNQIWSGVSDGTIEVYV